jgi:phosphoglycerate-specific signal transduction histidine kinase
LRAQIGRLNARLAALREVEQVALVRGLAEQRRLTEHLQQNLTSIQNRIARYANLLNCNNKIRRPAMK